MSVGQHSRSQYVGVGSALSAVVACMSGVLQGRVLGPLLFAIYISSFGNIVAAHHVHCHQYIDDTQLYMAFQPNNSAALSAVSDCIADVSRWFLENGLLLNPSKMEAVVFSAHEHRQTRLTQLMESTSLVQL